jgi:aryl-alcohol dehydrogenase-like predicted oxidoreductase
MQRFPLPGTDLSVSPLCFGAADLGARVRGADAERLVAAYLDAGGAFFDTAHCYGFWTEAGTGSSERELGRVLRALGVLESVTVATKGAHPAEGAAYPRVGPFLSERELLRDIAESRDRIGVETIDLYYLHRDDGVTPVGEILEILAHEIARGRLRAIAVSNWSVERLAAADAYAAAHGLPRFVASQVQGSLAIPTFAETADPTWRRLTDPMRAWHQQAGLALVAFSATSNGYFAADEHSAPIAAYDTPENAARRARARQLGAQRGASATQIALAWLRAQSTPESPVIPLFSTASPVHLAEALTSVDIALTADEARWLRDG